MIQRKALSSLCTNVCTHKRMCRCVSACTFIYLYIYMCLYTCLPHPTITVAEGNVEAYFKTKQIACWHFHFQNVSINCFVKSNIISISLNHYSSKQCFPFKNALLFTTKFCWFINFTVPKLVILQSMLITWLDLMLLCLNFFLKMRSELQGCIVLNMSENKDTNNTEITYPCKWKRSCSPKSTCKMHALLKMTSPIRLTNFIFHWYFSLRHQESRTFRGGKWTLLLTSNTCTFSVCIS